jgi:3-oxoacyl-[acyl-carrier protein] reductase
MLLKNKTVVLTGSNRGIGKSILEILSKNGANVFACVRTIDEKFLIDIENLKNSYKNDIIPVQIDLLDEESVKQAGKKILEQKKEIDVLINNAGAIHTALFQMTSQDKLKEMFQVNFFSQALFTQYILKSMIKKKNGSIIFISSNSAIDSNIGRSAYSASKAAIISLSKTLSRELGGQNIRVNTVAPGLTTTDMMKNNTSDKAVEEYVSSVSVKRLGKPNEIADLVIFLSSDKSNYITGQVIRVDGGI